MESLPDTGESNKTLIPAFAAFLAGLGLLRRKKKNEDENPEESK
ncbi:LPXTG cell wall anchor domain-containing protein [Macrococcoides bohemicum]|nr:LPXTG cell wall anchor domain-containing protein [Macrococcus bohemicus]